MSAICAHSERERKASSEHPTADKISRAERSRIMGRVRSENTSPELAVRTALRAAGFRYRLHKADLPGKPDIVLSRHSTVVFVNGCLWHGHECNRFRWPISNKAYWRAKIERNVKRDEVNRIALEQAGWKVRVVWDCDLKPGITAILADLQDN